MVKPTLSNLFCGTNHKAIVVNIIGFVYLSLNSLPQFSSGWLCFTDVCSSLYTRLSLVSYRLRITEYSNTVPDCFVSLSMYKTAVYTLVNGVITHQKQQISKK